MQLRVDQLVPYGYADTAISTFHAFGDRLIREFAFELGPRARRPGAVAARGRGLPARATVRPRPGRVPAARRSDALPRRARHRCSRAAATRTSRPRRTSRTRTRLAVRAAELEATVATAPTIEEADRDARGGSRGGRAPAGRAGSAPTAGTRRSCASTARSTSATRSRWRSSSCANSAAARETLQARYRYILVDEFQDTNRAQSELVALLAERHRNVTVVGDDDQSIYRFRGAAISNILEFRDRYRGARTVVLRRNYRSLAPILDGAHRLDLVQRPGPARGEGRHLEAADCRAVGPRRRRRSGTTRSRPPARRRTGSPPRSGDGSRPGARPRDHAVLVRANFDADPILRSLNAAALPWRFSGTSGLYARPEVRAPARAPAGGRGPGVERRRLRPGRLRALRRSPPATSPRWRDRRGGDTGACSRCSRSSRTSPACSASRRRGRAALARLTADLRRYRDLAQRRPAGEVLYAFLRDSGWLAELAGGDERRRPRSSSRTSAGSSTSSGRSRRCSPTTGRSSLRATSRR